MSSQTRHIYEFGPFRLDAAERLFARDGAPVPLTPRVFDLLLALVERRGRLLEKEELLQIVWRDAVVEEANLSANISILRKALGEDGQPLIETVPKRGYRFVAEVREIAVEHEQPEPAVKPVAVRRSNWRWLALACGVLLVAAAGFYFWRDAGRPALLKSLAVLPLENLSGDPQQEYFADGMTEALISNLSQVRALRVISRTSVMRFKGSRQSLAEIARELNVDAVIEGSVQRDGGRVKVTARLIRAANETPLRSFAYERELADVLKLQGEVAQAVAREVQIELTPAEQTRLAAARAVNPEAYQAYLKGVFYWNQARHTSDQQAEELFAKSFGCFEQALKTDPNYAQAYAGLARAYHWQASRGQPFYHFYSKAKTAAQQAIALDETLAEAHDALAFTLWRSEWDWAGAAREYQRASELGADTEINHGYGLYLSAAGRHSEAIAQLQRAQELDPLTLPVKINLGFVYAQARQYDRALAQFRNVLELTPQNDWLRLNLGVVYVYQRQYAEGLAEIQQALETWRPSPGQYPRGYLAWAYAAAGKKAEARKLLAELKARAPQYPTLMIELARTYAVLGEPEQALAWLEQAYQARTYRLLLINTCQGSRHRAHKRLTTSWTV